MKPVPQEKRFNYRLIQQTYRNSVANEDGPGSLQNIVTSDASRRVIASWMDEDALFGQTLKEQGLTNLAMPNTAQNGWIEYSYKLESQPVDGGDWEYVGCVNSNCETAEEFDERQERQFWEDEDYEELEDYENETADQPDSHEFEEPPGYGCDREDLCHKYTQLEYWHEQLSQKYEDEDLKTMTGYNILKTEHDKLTDIFHEVCLINRNLDSEIYELRLQLESRFLTRLARWVRRIFRRP